MHRHETDQELSRREFLGLFAGLLAAGPHGAADFASGDRSGARCFPGHLPDLIVPPAVIGPEWRLDYDALLASLDHPEGWILNEMSRLGLLCSWMDMAPASLGRWLSERGVRAAAELDYFAEHEGRRGSGCFVELLLYETTDICRGRWEATFADPDQAGFIERRELGDAAYESFGKWSFKGKLFFRRKNLSVAVIGIGHDDLALKTARLFDARIQSSLVL